MDTGASEAEVSTVREQLSGACTTEIATFDEFAAILASDGGDFDHVIFDTAPTGHTLRLLSLPKAWSGFLDGNDRGASCLGPHSGLKMQESRFKAALNALTNPSKTSVILVTRPDSSAIAEAARTSEELHALGLNNQRLVINSVFHASDRTDAVACSIDALGERSLAEMPESLRALPQDQVPLRTFDTIGLPALRALLAAEVGPAQPRRAVDAKHFGRLRGLNALADELAGSDHGLIMVMGKGGVGKTTVAAALALGLVKRRKIVHLSTTDPAAHLAGTLNGEVPGLRVSRIDPKVETQRYVEKIVAAKSGLSAQDQALLQEDLRSPCTEEVAVFHAFSRIVSEARSAFVVLDTAPTGHSLLLMDATGAYHRQMMRELEGHGAKHVITPLMRLQDAKYTKIILVTLPEVTPVSQAAALQDDLRRANIEPYAWLLNKSVLAAGTQDPLLAARLEGEHKQIERLSAGLAQRIFILPWLTSPPVGIAELSKLAGGS
jgi:arsenite-transporting ATPase